MRSILAIGPHSMSHGEAKIFKHSCQIISKYYNTQIIDSSYTEHRVFRPIFVIFSLIYQGCHRKFDYVYLSYSRNKLMLLALLPILTILKKIKKFKVVYHIHDTSLKQNLTGVLGLFVSRLYEICIDLTILPNSYLETYSRVSHSCNITYLVNPYLGHVFKTDIVDPKNFHFISFPSRNKNLDKAIEFINEADLDLVVVGWNQSDFEKIYPNSRHSLENIKFLGVLPHDRVITELINSKGLLSISDQEAMPLNVIEALLLAIPIYVQVNSGYKYFLNNFETVSILNDHRDLLKKFTRNELIKSQRLAEKMFDKKMYNNKLLKLFEFL